MNTLFKVGLVLFTAATLSSHAAAQDTGDDAADVLLAIGEQWEANQKSDDDWTESMLADNFMGWGKTSPAPRSKSSTHNWNRFDAQLGHMVQHELYPLSVVVHEDVAVVHYLYTSAYKDKDGKIEVSNGRYTDVLIRTEDGWKFIAWHGGRDDD